MIDAHLYLWEMPEMIWIRFPKSAGGSVKGAVGNMAKLYRGQANNQRVEEIRNTCKPLIGVVRNPYSRLVSCWANKVTGNPISPLPGFDNSLTFSEFARKACDTNNKSCDWHLVSCCAFLEAFGRPLDIELHVENLFAEWAELGRFFNLPRLGRDKVSKHKPWREYYRDADLADMVYARYEDDFDMFGYERSVSV